MTVLADVPHLLRVAEQMPGDPHVDDYGVLVAAVERHRAVLMDTEVYGSVHLQAAALLHTLARLPALEARNITFAWVVALNFLSVNDITIKASPADAMALLETVTTGDAGLRQISARLTEWS